MNKVPFFKRLAAYFIDFIIISIVVSLIGSVLPGRDNITKLNNEYSEITQSYLDGNVSANEYINRSNLVAYDLDRASCLNYILEVTVIISYFVVFQFYNKGQTLGKKLMNIRVISDNGSSLTLNSYLYRAVILNSVLTNILTIVLVLFATKKYYLYLSFPLQMVQVVLILITIFMVLFRKDGRGLHDMVAHTKVIGLE